LNHLYPNIKVSVQSTDQVEKAVLENQAVFGIGFHFKQLNLVRSGVGRSVVSRTLYEFYETGDLYFQRIEKPSLNGEVYLTMKKKSFINYATRGFMELLINEIEKLQFNVEKYYTDTLKSLIR
jgi:DNA-binding transcriptional LysR family regulator